MIIQFYNKLSIIAEHRKMNQAFQVSRGSMMAADSFRIIQENTSKSAQCIVNDRTLPAGACKYTIALLMKPHPQKPKWYSSCNHMVYIHGLCPTLHSAEAVTKFQ